MECVVHGALPMMVSRYCALGSLVGGKCSDRTCTRPCKKGSFNLKDRLNYLFPLEFDEFCRMHVYNPKDLCLIEHLDQFLESGVRSIRIEGKRYHPETVFQVTNTYRKVKNAILSGTVNYIDFREIQDSLAVFSPAGFTKGHYFRGVL